jgi:hypothetical protein
MRIEKGYRAWGHELSPDTTPVEAGLMFAVDLEKEGGFLGKEAIVAQREALASGGGAGGGAPHPSMPSERLVNLKVDMDGGVPIVEYGGSPSPESSSTIPMLWGGEVRREV